MTISHYLFIVLLSSLIGSLFHLWQGGNGNKLILYIVVANIGFLTGQVIHKFWPINLLSIGPMQIGLGLITTIIFLFLMLWLLNFDPSETDEF
jgi:hypothetical protein